MTSELLSNYELFCKTLYEKMKQVTPVVEKMELYEFRYSLNNIIPEHGGWASVVLDPMKVIEERITSLTFYDSIEIKPKVDGNIVLDKSIENLTNMLLAGLVTGIYSPEWINAHFTFDPRGFNFLVRSTYLTPDIIAHLGGKPFKSFEPKQKAFESCHEVGYREFMTANQEVDELFIESILKLVKIKGTPVLLGIAGPTAAGKTEIVDRLREAFEHTGKKIAAIELDNFLLDRDFREDNNIGSFGKRALHFELLQKCINDAVAGKKIFHSTL